MSGRLIIRNTLFLTLASLAEKIIFLFFFAYVARTLGQTDFGRYSFVLAALTFLSIPLDLGFSNILVREVARARGLAGQYVLDITALKLLILAAEVALTAALAPVLIKDPLVAELLVWGLVGQGIANLSNGFFMLFAAFEEMGFQSLLQTAGNLLGVAVGALALRWGADLRLFFIWYGVVALVARAVMFAAAAAARYRRQMGARLGGIWGRWRGVIAAGFPFAVANLMMVFYVRIDSVLLYKLKGAAAVGTYNAALALVMGLIFLPGAVAGAVYPRFSVLYGQGSEMASAKAAASLIKGMLIISLPLAVGGSLMATAVIAKLYGAEYQSSAGVFRILCWALPAVFVTSAMGAISTARNQETAVAKIAAFNTLFNAMGNLVLISVWGALGAAATMVATHYFCWFQYRRWLRDSIYAAFDSVSCLGKPALACLVMAAVMYPVMRFAGFWWTIPAGIGAYCGTLCLLRPLSADETSLLRTFMHRQKDATLKPV